MEHAFTGFLPHVTGFFEQLAANNTKPWFEAHRHEFESYLMEPLKALVCDLADAMLAIDPQVITIPAVDKTISRIYRDTRFSRNKAPYKTCLWVSFKRLSKEWKDAPCFFFEITADSYRYGMGFYGASRETMDKLRRFIDTKPVEFRKIAACLGKQTVFELEGDLYRRPLNPGLAEDLQQWHQRKNVYLVCNREADARLFSPELRRELEEGFIRLAPLYHLLWRVRGG
ncbi:DUF2461 domain-containing protein [Oryzomonas sagensis]|uniref:DUF2461 domain-containing protein n=1 Tax=Oryzomonas sagensis TaxID=2603857 RepID=A0ABQ6TMV5_9BACT|nr:DUF2461 domain-containing protein [Oryzomonas sagensis]KAB0669801.1 DUF2461 domain-containing protein [Oryzomonas sagensis]